jgi:hypothetical protein
LFINTLLASLSLASRHYYICLFFIIISAIFPATC